MPRSLLFLLFIGFSINSSSQSLDASLSAGYSRAHSLHLFNRDVSTFAQPCLSVSNSEFLRISRHIDVGILLQYRAFDLRQNRFYHTVGSERVLLKASYLAVAPAIGIDLMPKGYLQVYAAIPIAFLLSGSQDEYIYHSYNSSENLTNVRVNGMYAGLNIGLKERIPLSSNRLYLLFDEQGTTMFSDLSKASASGGGGGSGVHVFYYSIEAGLAYRLKL